jgi:hypothetical protein
VRGLAVLLAFGVALAVVVAAAGSDASSSVRLTAILSGTVRKTWTYSTTVTEGDCRRTTSGTGLRTMTLRSRRRTTLTARLVGARLVFSPPAIRYLTGVVRQSGSQTTRTEGPAECDPKVTHADCAVFRRAFAGAAVRLFSPRRGSLRFRRAAFPKPRPDACPREPAFVREQDAGLHSAGGRIREGVLLDRSLRSFISTGDFTDSGEATGTTRAVVHERVHWTLTFRPG